MITFYRQNSLLNQVLIVDGQAGCGKTMLTNILSSYDRIEHFKYCSEIENICTIYQYNKIDFDAAKSFIKIYMDEQIYNSMMSRNLNFRFSDLSSAFNSTKLYTYIKRLFNKGDKFIPEKILKEKPILQFATHSLLAHSEILFQSLKEKILIIEVVRHPAYMIEQQTLNQENFDKVSARDFHVRIKKNNNELPFWLEQYDFENEKLLPIDRAIFQMAEITNQVKKFHKKNNNFNVFTIPFEEFVIRPNLFLEKIENLLKVSRNNKTNSILRREKIPRKNLSEGRNLKIYREYGWKNLSKLSFDEEIEFKKSYIKKMNASDDSIKLFNKLCKNYENEYPNIFKNSI